MSKKITVISLIVLPLMVWFFPGVVSAAAADTFRQGLFTNVSTVCYAEGECNFCDALQIIINVSRVILMFSGAIAWVFLLWGSIGFITSSGNSEKVESNKNLMKSALFGIVIVLASWQLVMMILAIMIDPSALQGEKSIEIFSASWNSPKCK